MRKSMVSLALAAVAGLGILAARTTVADDNSKSSQAAATVAKVGEMAPEFSLSDQDGKAVTLSMLRGRNVVLVFYPADLQFKPEDIPRLCAPILAGDADMVTGFKEGKYEKAFVSRVYNGLNRLLFDIPVRDLNSVKAYRREIMEQLPVRPDWHRYMIVIAAASGFTVTEVPVPLYPRNAGRSKFECRAGRAR